MPFVPTANTVMAELRFLLDGQRVENTLFFQGSSTIDAPELVALGDALVDWFETNVQPLQADAVLFREIYLTDLTSETALTHTRVVIPNTVGGVASPPLPNNVTLTVSFRSAGRGRFSRGRNYFIGLTEAQVGNNAVSLTLTDDLAAAYNALPAALPAGFVWVVCSRYTAAGPRPAGFNSPVVAALVVDNVVDSQRRRLPGRGS